MQECQMHSSNARVPTAQQQCKSAKCTAATPTDSYAANQHIFIHSLCIPVSKQSCNGFRSFGMLHRFDSQLVWCVVGNHGPVSKNSRSANFTAGFHSIEVDYCNMGGSAALSLFWKGPNDTTYSVRFVPCQCLLESSPLPTSRTWSKDNLSGHSKLPSTMTHMRMFVCMLVCICACVHGTAQGVFSARTILLYIFLSTEKKYK